MSLENEENQGPEKVFSAREMYFNSYASMAEGESSKDHSAVMAALNLYLEFVPIGTGSQERGS
jgi:hypothetical protein